MPVSPSFSTGVIAAFAALGATAASAQITIPTVFIGNSGNTGDTRVMTTDGTTGYGAVGHLYNIGTHEVTAGQYTAFLNAVARTDTNGLYDPAMASAPFGCGIAQSGSSGNYTYSVNGLTVNRPVNHVTFWDAARFANWLHNGQPTGPQNGSTTEDGAYTLTESGIAANTVVRNPGWQWAVSSEDEWYKAAYYKRGGTNAGYWLYPTGTDTLPGNDPADPSGNNANHYTGSGAYPIANPFFITLVGEFQNSASPFGTFDQGGNVWEWSDSIISGTLRCFRGSSFSEFDVGRLPSDFRAGIAPVLEGIDLGFRVSQTTTCIGDLNGDNAVNTSDLTVLLSRFGTVVAPGGTGDFNHDGAVNTQDLTTLLARFGIAC